MFWPQIRGSQGWAAPLRAAGPLWRVELRGLSGVCEKRQNHLYLCLFLAREVRGAAVLAAGTPQPQERPLPSARDPPCRVSVGLGFGGTPCTPQTQCRLGQRVDQTKRWLRSQENVAPQGAESKFHCKHSI